MNVTEAIRPARGRAANVARFKALLLAAALASFLLSVSLYFIADDKTAGIFVGIWVPSVLSMGSMVLARGEGSR